MNSYLKSGIAVTAFSAAMAQPWTALAQEVTLQTNDNSVAIAGRLLGYDGSTYTVQTLFGEVEVDALLVSCTGDGCPATEAPSEEEDVQVAQMTIGGDAGLVKSLVPGLAESFAADIAATSVAAEDSSDLTLVSGTGENLLQLAMAAEGADAGLNAFKSGDANLVLTRKKAADTAATVVALDGVVVITSPQNPVRAISEKALAGIFSGKITNWSQLGLPSAPIKVLTPPASSAASELFAEKIVSANGGAIAGTEVTENADLLAAVASDPLAIAFTNYSTAQDAKVVDISGECGIQVPATDFTIQTEEYPLTQRVYAYSQAGDSAVGQRLADFLVSDKAQSVVGGTPLIDLNPHMQGNNEQGLRYLSAILPGKNSDTNFRKLQDLAALQLSADRVSITFRFNLGSAQLDERALEDVNRLADLLTTGSFENKEVMLIGFTDSIGDPGANLGLSQRRAAFVLDQLRAAAPAGSLDGITLSAAGFGENSPVACNDSQNGLAINRRVEVWIKDKVRTAG